jgi:hypothetical protein
MPSFAVDPPTSPDAERLGPQCPGLRGPRCALALDREAIDLGLDCTRRPAPKETRPAPARSRSQAAHGGSSESPGATWHVNVTQSTEAAVYGFGAGAGRTGGEVIWAAVAQ